MLSLSYVACFVYGSLAATNVITVLYMQCCLVSWHITILQQVVVNEGQVLKQGTISYHTNRSSVDTTEFGQCLKKYQIWYPSLDTNGQNDLSMRVAGLQIRDCEEFCHQRGAQSRAAASLRLR